MEIGREYTCPMQSSLQHSHASEAAIRKWNNISHRGCSSADDAFRRAEHPDQLPAVATIDFEVGIQCQQRQLGVQFEESHEAGSGEGHRNDA